MSKHEGEILGHPKGLFVLFFTEMWERFSFYGMKALLIFYLTKYHLFTDEVSTSTVASYAALVYTLPIIGGYLADKYLGFRKAVIYGAILLVLGHLGMAYEGSQAFVNAAGEVVRDNTAVQAFYFSMGLIIMGVGFLKPNISTIVGELYGKNDTRRDAGFTIFYMGINIGSFASTILCGWLGETYGWKYGFGLAGIGMIFGLLVFLWGKKYLLNKAEAPNPAYLKQRSPLGFVNNEWMIYLLSFSGVLICWQLVQRHHIVDWLMVTISVIALVYILWFMYTKCDKVQRNQMFSLLILFFFSVVFWSIYEQQYTSLNLFTDRVLDRHVFGFEIKASLFLSLNALFIFILAPFVAWIWLRLGKKNREPNNAVKFGMGIIFAALAYLIVVFGINNLTSSGQVAAAWLVLAYLFLTLGELAISPVGLSTVTKLTPQHLVGFMMGVWFLATAAAEQIAGKLANIAKVDMVKVTGADGKTSSVIKDIPQALGEYHDLFNMLFYVGLGAGLLLLLLSPIVKKLTHGVK
jgi:POT family proton-dependent oligopeptide transporter